MKREDDVVLRTYPRETDALAAVMHLEASGIQVTIRKDDAGGSYPSLNLVAGVELVVSESQASAAAALLETFEVGDDPEVGPVAGEKNFQAGAAALFFGGFFVGILATVVVLSLFRDDPNQYTGPAEYDQNGDGTPDLWYEYMNGRIKSGKNDRNFDGKTDAWYLYEDQGIPKRMEFDDNFDGSPDSWFQFEHGRRVSAKIDTDFDGIADATSLYDESDIKTQTDWHPRSGPIVRRETFRNGILREELADQDGDGKFDIRKSYDPFGTVVAVDRIE